MEYERAWKSLRQDLLYLASKQVTAIHPIIIMEMMDYALTKAHYDAMFDIPEEECRQVEEDK